MSELQYSLPVIGGQQQLKEIFIKKQTSKSHTPTKTLPRADFSIILQSVPEIQNPAGKLSPTEEVSVVRYMITSSDWKQVAEVSK